MWLDPEKTLRYEQQLTLCPILNPVYRCQSPQPVKQKEHLKCCSHKYQLLQVRSDFLQAFFPLSTCLHLHSVYTLSVPVVCLCAHSISIISYEAVRFQFWKRFLSDEDMHKIKYLWAKLIGERILHATVYSFKHFLLELM